MFALDSVQLALDDTGEAEKTSEVKRSTRTEKKVETKHNAATAADEDFAVERRVDAAADVALSLCLASGDVIVRGWDRTEVRARVSETGGVKLDAGGGSPARRVEVIVAEDKEAQLEPGGCGSTSTLELMVPRGASVTISARNGHVEISEVAEAHVQSLSGDVDVRRASKSVEVSCLSGD